MLASRGWQLFDLKQGRVLMGKVKEARVRATLLWPSCTPCLPPVVFLSCCPLNVPSASRAVLCYKLCFVMSCHVMSFYMIGVKSFDAN